MSDLGQPIVLIGMMGAGKTTVGKLLAGAIERDFVDLDEVVAATAHSTIPALFTTEGEAAFREREVAALRSVLQLAEAPVVAAGGGLVTGEVTRALLRSAAQCVWLRAEPQTLADRVGSGAGRPLLKGDPIAVLTSLCEARAQQYDDAADLVVDVDDRTPAEVVEVLLELLGTAGA